MSLSVIARNEGHGPERRGNLRYSSSQNRKGHSAAQPQPTSISATEDAEGHRVIEPQRRKEYNANRKTGFPCQSARRKEFRGHGFLGSVSPEFKSVSICVNLWFDIIAVSAFSGSPCSRCPLWQTVFHVASWPFVDSNLILRLSTRDFVTDDSGVFQPTRDVDSIHKPNTTFLTMTGFCDSI